MARPVGSVIRQNIVEILSQINRGYGYQIFKIYKEIFPKATMRSIYYHLRKGLQTLEIKVEGIERTSGNYSWGGEAEKTIYSLGPNASPKGDQRVANYFRNVITKT